MNNHIPSFEDFLNESFVNENLASKIFNMDDTVDMIMDEFDDTYQKNLHKRACKLLGSNPNAVCRLDSEGDYDGEESKAFDYLQSHFSHDVNDSKFSELYYDKSMNVVRLDDYGFVAYFYTNKSKF